MIEEAKAALAWNILLTASYGERCGAMWTAGAAFYCPLAGSGLPHQERMAVQGNSGWSVF
ncbi:MAG TPA: hypothetical protein VFD58_09220 [Blastocatellia bacterium]|nr:hypothetical protein [Blastocatellia bacterium]